MACASERTPVEVSTCVKVRILYVLDCRADAIVSRGTVAPIGALSWSTEAP